MRVGVLLFLFALTVSALGACGGGNGNDNTATVNGQTAPETIQTTLRAHIFSSLAEGKGTTTCPATCEFTFTAGANDTEIAHQEIDSLNFKCDTKGLMETGQGFEAPVTIDLSNSLLDVNASLEASCAPASGFGLFNTITLNFYSATAPFNKNLCSGGSCDLPLLEMSSISDEANKAGVTDFLKSLPCPTLSFFFSFCLPDSTEISSEVEEPSIPCVAIAAASVFLGCDLDFNSVCGDGQVTPDEACDVGANKQDPSDDKLDNCSFKPTPGTTCSEDCKQCIPSADQECPKGSHTCLEDSQCSTLGNYICFKGCCEPVVCGDGIKSGKELCDVGIGSPDLCPSGVCIASICRCCGDGACDSDQGENTDNCSSDCGPLGEICDNGADDDKDGLTDCEDTADCCSTISCEGSLACCGDHVTQAWEDCDDGNILDADGCSSTCHAVCGDGFLTKPKETCDPTSKDSGNTLCQTQFGSSAFGAPPTCNGDCLCEGYCGDGTCDGTVGETVHTCYQDCHTCSDGFCDPRFDDPNDDKCSDCKGDNAPPVGCMQAPFCDAGETINNCYYGCRSCGDGVCDLIGVGGVKPPKGTKTATDFSCYIDCHHCGDEICDADKGETKENCPKDCSLDSSQPPSCGDGTCDTCAGENEKTCYVDCWRCGDKICDDNKGETSITCSVDCPPSLAIKLPASPTCNGNGICEPDLVELRNFCYDCHYCGDGICDQRAGFDPIDCIDCHGMPPTCGTSASCECGESSQTCLQDCTKVGDKICDGASGETNLNSIDCSCGDGVKDPVLEYCESGTDTTCVDTKGPGYICAPDCLSCIFTGIIIGPPPAPTQ